MFTCLLDVTQMETEMKGTVQLHADELMNYIHSRSFIDITSRKYFLVSRSDTFSPTPIS